MSTYWQDDEDALYEESYAEEWDGRAYEDWEWRAQEPGAYPPDLARPLLFGVFLLFFWLLARSGPATTWPTESPVQAPVVVPVLKGVPGDAESAPAQLKPGPAEPIDPEAFAAPYADYVITQGIHGQSYGHMAIDLAAGKGASILSPIDGTVREVYIDQWGNPTLIIENEIYEVKLLHGVYSVQAGDSVRLGERVGEESNLGYTTDMRGVPCKGRTDYCGYHTHLNVFNKQLGVNVNPLELIR